MKVSIPRLCAALVVTMLSGVATLVSLPVHAEGSKLGVLTCTSIPGTRLNLLIRSTTDVHCEFKDERGRVDYYLGETGIAFGADLTFAKTEESFAFTVISASDIEVGEHTLAGKYVGGKASASVGVGIGAAVLVGGSYDNFSLQPIALEGNTGIGAALGIGFLYIEKAR